MKRFLTIGLMLLNLQLQGQGMNSHWLMGYWPFNSLKGRFIFDTSSYSFQTEFRKMMFTGTQATLSDHNGNFLMSSNGVWIANALNDTMMNGSGLNPSWDVNAHPNGLLNFHGNVLLTYPGDSLRYILIHHALFVDPFTYNYLGGIHKSIIDITMDSGLGAITEKNDTLIVDQLSMGIAACKHANGRDWWVIAQKDSSDIVYKILLTPNGVESIATQNLGYNQFFYG
ncbi:MAG: hypothetical protein JNL47_03980, partial [Bacteroidia bacterium]|nr:hypothetical protein [Bacteroidia bacterium]